MAVMLGNLDNASEDTASSLATLDAIADLRSDFGDLRSDLGSVKKDVAKLKTDMVVLKWIAGSNLALVVAVLGLLLKSMH